MSASFQIESALTIRRQVLRHLEPMKYISKQRAENYKQQNYKSETQVEGEHMKIATNKLLPIHREVYEYLKKNCIGEANGVSMHDLAEQMTVSDREMRDIIPYLIKNKQGKTIIASGNKGYYIPLNEEEATKSKNAHKSRLESTLERYIATYGYDADWIYRKVTESKAKYDANAQNQTVMEFTKGQRPEVNHFGQTYVEQRKKSYSSLFEFETDNVRGQE